MRPPIKTNCGFSIISGIALVLWVLTSPIGIPRTPNARVYPNSRSRDFARASDGLGVALTSATPDGAFIDSHRSVFIKEDEAESFCSFSHLVSQTCAVLSGPLRPG